MSSRATQAQAAEALEHLRQLVVPGSTLYTTVTHAARMSRNIRVFRIADNQPHDLSHLVADALRRTLTDRGVKIGGCGMDMGVALVMELSHALYPNGFGCLGSRELTGDSCPSNDHFNGDRDYSPHTCTWDQGESEKSNMGNLHHHDREQRGVEVGKFGTCHWHPSGAYAVRQRWL